MNERLKVSAQLLPMQDSVQLFLHTDNQYCSQIIMAEVEPGQFIDHVPIELKHDMAQRLFDQLWNIGFRPYNNKYGDEVVKTMSNHLEDMRKIAFQFLSKE